MIVMDANTKKFLVITVYIRIAYEAGKGIGNLNKFAIN
jgi:hypothetical protein